MNPVNSRVKAITAQRFDSAALTGGYDLFNAGGLSHPCFLIRIVNESNVLVEVSYDGVHTHDIVPDGESITLNFQTNSRQSGKLALWEKGKLLWLLGVSQQPAGYIYLIGYYQD